ADIDLARYALTEPTLSCFRGHPRNVHDFTNKFMANDAAELVITAQNLNVGIANAREAHADQRPAGFQFWQRLAICDEPFILDREAEHARLLLCFFREGAARGRSSHALQQFEFRFQPDEAAIQITAS